MHFSIDQLFQPLVTLAMPHFQLSQPLEIQNFKDELFQPFAKFNKPNRIFNFVAKNMINHYTRIQLAFSVLTTPYLLCLFSVFVIQIFAILSHTLSM